MRCLKNIILKTLGWLNFIAFIIAACAIDSYSWQPFIVCCITGTYLAVFAYANDWFEGCTYE
jgi:hypothetical protein